MYNLVRISSENLYRLVYLYKHCFNYDADINFLTKKYNTNAFGHSFIGYIAIDNLTNESAAYYGVFPIICKKGNERILSAQSGDTMTHPKHQGKGLFVLLAKETYSLAEKEGIKFIFGFPNSNSYPGFIKKLNWIYYADINNYVIETGAFPLDKISKRYKVFSKYFTKYVQKIIKPLLIDDVVTNSLSLQLPNLGYVIHDKDFYEYKTYNTVYKISLNNVACVIKIDGRLWVGDIEFCDDNDFIETIVRLKYLAKKMGCSTIHLTVFNNSKYDKLLKQKYNVKYKNPVGCLKIGSNIDPTQFCFQSLDFDTF